MHENCVLMNTDEGAHLQGGAIRPPPGVRGQRRHALALVHHACKVGEAVLVTLRLLHALHAGASIVRTALLREKVYLGLLPTFSRVSRPTTLSDHTTP